MESDLPLIEIAEEDDSLLQQFPDLNQTPLTYSPFALPPSNSKYLKDCVRMEKSNSSSSEACNNKENINSSIGEGSRLGMEPVQMKRKKKGAGYNLRKSLAWDKAFFTDEGILDASEMTLITGIDASTCGGGLSTISEEENSLFSSDVKCTNESNDTGTSEEAPLKELRDKNRTPKGNREKTDCLIRNRGSLLRHKVTNKVLTSDRANRIGPNVGGCSQSLAASSLKRPANSNTLKTANKESKIPRLPISKPGSCSYANNATTKGSMSTSQLGHSLISKPTNNVEKNFGLKSSLQKVHGSQSKPKSSSSNLRLPVRELAKKTTKNLTQPSKAASSTRSRLVQVDGANNKSEMIPATLQACKISEASAPLAAKHFAQHAAANSNNSLSEAARLTSSGPCHIQEATKGLMISDRLKSSESQDHPSAVAKPSGLRKPSPSLRLFDLRTSSESAPLQQTKVQQYMGSDRKYGDMLPPARPPMKSNDITENARCVALTPGKEFCVPSTQSPSPNYMFNTSTKRVPDSNVYQNPVKKITCNQLIFEGRVPETQYKPVIHNEEDGLQSYTASSMSTCGEFLQHKEETISTGVDDLDHAQTSSEQADFKSSDDAPLKVNLDHAQIASGHENDVFNVVDDKSLPMEEHDVTKLKDEVDVTELKGEADVTELKGQADVTELNGEADVTDLNGEADVTELKGEADVTDLKGEADVTELKGEADVTELKGVDTFCIPFQSLNTEKRNDDADCVDVFSTKSPRVRDASAELQNSSSFEDLNIEPTHIIEINRKLPVTLLLHDHPPSTEGREPETKYKTVLYNEEDGLQSYTVSSMSAFGQSRQHQEETILTGVDDLVPAQTSWEQADTAKSDDASPKVNSESHLDACSQVFVESHEQDGIGSHSGVLQHEQENIACKVVDDKSLPVEEDDSRSSRTISIGLRDSHSLEYEVGVTELKFINTSCISFENLNTEQRNDDAEGADVFSTTAKSPRVRDPSAEEGNGVHIDPTTFISSKAQSNDSSGRDTVRQILNDGPSTNSFTIEPTPSIDIKHKLPVTLVLHDNPSSTEASPLNKSQLPDTSTANGSINCFEATSPCISALLNSQLSEERAFHNEADINDRLFQEKSVLSAMLIEVLGQKQDGVDVELITSSVGEDSLVKSESVLQGAPCTGTYPQSLEKERLDIAAPTVEAYHVENHKSQEMGLVAEKSQHYHASISETKPTIQGCTGGPETHSQFQSENQTLEGSGPMLEEKTTLFLDDRVLMKGTLPSTEKILDSKASVQILLEENSEENSKSVQGRTDVVVPEENSHASSQILPAVLVNADHQHHGFIGITHSVETPDYFTNGKSDSSFSVSQELSTGVEAASLEKEFGMSQLCCLIGTKTTCMIEAEESKISNGEQIDATPVDGGFQHELDDFIDHKDAKGLMRSNSIKRQDNSLVIHPSTVVPSSDEWLASFEAAGELLINEYEEYGLQSYTASSMSTFGQPIQHQEETISTGADDIDNGRTSLEQVKTEKSDDAPLKVNPESHLDANSQVFVEFHEQDVVTKGENYVGSTKCVAPGVESYSGVLPHCQESDVYKVVDDKTLPMEEHDVTELKGVDSSCILFQSLNTEHRNDDADGEDVFSTTTKLLRVTDLSAELHDSPSPKGLNNESTLSLENEHKLPVTLVLHDNQSTTEGLQHFIPANFIKNNSQLQDTDTANGSLNCFEATTCVSALLNSQLSVSCIIPEESSCLEEGTFHNVTDFNDHNFQENRAEFISETASVGDDTRVENKSVLQGAQFTGTNLQSLEKERADIAAETIDVQHQILVENKPQGLVGITHSVETHDCFTNGKSNSSFSVSQETTSTPQSCCLVGTETTYMIEAEGLKINIGEEVDATPIVGGFKHELDDPKDTTVLTRSDSVKRQDNSLVIHPLNAVPSSDEWLPAFEAAGELSMNEYEENGLQSYTASSMSTFGQSSQHKKETISAGVDDLDRSQTSREQVGTEKSKDLPPKVNHESHLEADSEVFVELHDSPVRDNVAQLLNSIPSAETSSIENKSSAEATTPCISAIQNSQLSEEGTFHNVTDINDDLFQEKCVSGAVPIGQNQDVDLISREVASLINEQVEFISETASVGDDAERSKINIEEQADATVLTKGSNSIKRQDKSLAICPPTAVPFSDEWLAAIEAAGVEILTMKGGAVQHSPPDKSLPEPSPWSPVKKKGNQIGPYDCTKYTNAMPTSSQVSDQ